MRGCTTPWEAPRNRDPADDAVAIDAVGRMRKPHEEGDVRMVVIDNPLHLRRVWVSGPVLEEVRYRPGLRFGADGRWEA